MQYTSQPYFFFGGPLASRDSIFYSHIRLFNQVRLDAQAEWLQQMCDESKEKARQENVIQSSNSIIPPLVLAKSEIELEAKSKTGNLLVFQTYRVRPAQLNAHNMHFLPQG